MTLVRRTRAVRLVLALLAVAGPSSLAAQGHPPIKKPPVKADTSAVAHSDSTKAAKADTSAKADTTKADTAQVLPHPLLPVVTPQNPPGPMPPGERYIFTRDSLVWTQALSLADLLATIPGTYVARGGFLAMPQPVIYGGRGTDGIEIYWDGVPMTPLGPDSTAIDPGHISLFYLDRVEVIVLPAGLRVYLTSARQGRPHARSTLRIVSGSNKTGGYAGLFQDRFPSGLGLNLGADFLGAEATNAQGGPVSGGNTNQWFDIWGKADWTPTPTLSASYQVRRQNYQRDVVGADNGAPLVPAQKGTRTDAIVQLAASTRPNHFGPGIVAGLATSAWTKDSSTGDRRMHQAFLTLGYRGASSTLELTGRTSDLYTTAEGSARIGWTPFRGLALSGDARLARHTGERTSRAVHGALGLYGGPFSLVGEAAVAKAVAVPAFLSDTAVKTRDLALRAGFVTRPLNVHVTLQRRDGYVPHPLDAFPQIVDLGTSVPYTYLVTDVHLRPFRPLTLSAWYANPMHGAQAAFEPPHHLRGEITFRSKFWRTFRSGAFDLEIQGAVESWNAGFAGRGGTSGTFALPAGTLTEIFIQFEVAGFKGFWDLRNANNAKATFVPNVPYIRNGQSFGVKWVFTN